MTHSPSRRGFTLVELLVVITIIGILVAILVPSVFIVRKQVLNGRIAFEISGLEQAINAYKLESGGAPPPNTDPTSPQVITAHIIKRFPRSSQQQRNDILAEAQKLDPTEVLPFWMGIPNKQTQMALRNSPTMPFSATGEAKQFFNFEQGRFTDVDGDGWQEYSAPNCQGAPYVYFDARYYNRVTGPIQINNTIDGTNPGKVVPYSSGRDPIDNRKRLWVNPDTFQIICAGQDGLFEDPDHGGATSAGLFDYPAGPYNDPGERDNITNFSETKTLQDAIP